MRTFITALGAVALLFVGVSAVEAQATPADPITASAELDTEVDEALSCPPAAFCCEYPMRPECWGPCAIEPSQCGGGGAEGGGGPPGLLLSVTSNAYLDSVAERTKVGPPVVQNGPYCQPPYEVDPECFSGCTNAGFTPHECEQLCCNG